MPKCWKCDYPYATTSKCPNCGFDDPTNKKGGEQLGTVVVLILLIIGGIWGYNNYNSNHQSTEYNSPPPIQSAPYPDSTTVAEDPSIEGDEEDVAPAPASECVYFICTYQGFETRGDAQSFEIPESSPAFAILDLYLYDVGPKQRSYKPYTLRCEDDFSSLETCTMRMRELESSLNIDLRVACTRTVDESGQSSISFVAD